MNFKLKIFLIIICLIFNIFVYNKIKKGKLQLKYSFIWYILSFILILITIFDKLLVPIKNMLGFETTSNMIFLIGFFSITMIIFSINTKVSEQNLKIVKLTQEIALIKKENEKNVN